MTGGGEMQVEGDGGWRSATKTNHEGQIVCRVVLAVVLWSDVREACTSRSREKEPRVKPRGSDGQEQTDCSLERCGRRESERDDCYG